MKDLLRSISGSLQEIVAAIDDYLDEPTEPPTEPPVDPPSDGSWWEPPSRWIFRPTGLGRNIPVRNTEELKRALGNAVPGDCINLATAEYGPFVWQKHAGHKSGSLGRYITVQAEEGAKPTFTGPRVAAPADVFRVEDIDHFRLSGLDISRSQFVMRIFSSTFGEVLHCHVHDSGHALVAVQDFSREAGQSLAKGDPSRHILFEGCHVHDAGKSLTGDQPYGEAFYLGHGGEPWQHKPDDIEIRWCDVHDTIGDGVDIKLGSSNINIHHNKFHDMDVPSGAVISHGPHATPDPEVDIEKPILIHDNRIWNIGHGGRGSVYGIVAFTGGERIWNNRMWSFAYKKYNTRAINLRGISDGVPRYPIEVRDNILWVERSIVEYFTAGPAPTINKSGNLTVDGAEGSQAVTAGWFHGPVPGLWEQSDAMAEGSTDPGSAFDLAVA